MSEPGRMKGFVEGERWEKEKRLRKRERKGEGARVWM
jgi:hypothetical protein